MLVTEGTELGIAEGSLSLHDPLFDVSGKVFLVTGASSGIGAHFAEFLASRGAYVVGMSRTVGESTSPRVSHVTGDVTIEQDILDAFDHAEAAFGPVDVIISNAGAGNSEPVGEISDAQAAVVFQTNITAGAILAQEGMLRMRKHGKAGSIIHISSTLSSCVMPSLAVYAASKAALDHLMKHQAQAWARYGIRVNALAPGWFETNMTRDALDKGLAAVLKAKTPMRRIGELDDLNGPLLLLASDASRFMTGTIVTVDGGFCIGG